LGAGSECIIVLLLNYGSSGLQMGGGVKIVASCEAFRQDWLPPYRVAIRCYELSLESAGWRDIFLFFVFVRIIANHVALIA